MTDQPDATLNEIGPECIKIGQATGLYSTDGVTVSELIRRVPDFYETQVRIISTTTSAGGAIVQRVISCDVEETQRCDNCVLKLFEGENVENGIITAMSPTQTIEHETGEHL